MPSASTPPAMPVGIACPSATGHPAYTQSIACEPASARRARLLVNAVCNTWGLSDLAEDAALVVSELIANAIAHSGSRMVRVTVSRVEPRRVRVAVVDTSRTHPTPRTASETDENGRGLAVVEAVSDRRGTDSLPWGKRAWAELRAPED